MSRSTHTPLERSETAIIPGGALGRRARRRAALEKELTAAVAEGDAEMMSRIRGELALLEGAEAQA